MQITLPYGRSAQSAFIPNWVNASCVKTKEWQQTDSEQDLVRTALKKPYGLPRLVDLAHHSHSAIIVTCDKTRGVPSHTTLPLILEELAAGGLNRERVHVLVATGLHKGESTSDVRERLGSELLENLEVTVHDSDEHGQLSFVGNLSSGTPLILNKAVLEHDLVILESGVEPHFFAGFTGGSKVILPGAAGTETILRNHNWQKIDDPRSRYGIIKNPIRADANEAMRFFKRAFALNLILNAQKKIIHATAGDTIDSFNAAANMVIEHSRILVKNRPDIVITTNGGYPLDRNVYQCVKGIAVPEEILQPGSKIIMVGECVDGVAHEEFRRMLLGAPPNELYEKLKTSEATARDQWEVQVLCRILRHNSVWFVTREEIQSDIESMHMNYAPTVEEALNAAGLSKDERVLIAPEGPATILKAG